MAFKLKFGALPTRWKIGLPMFALVLVALIGLRKNRGGGDAPKLDDLLTASVKLSKNILPQGTARDWNVELGLRLARGKHFPQARKVFEEVLLLEPTNVSLLNNMAYIVGELGDYPKAAEYLQTALQISDTCAECHNNMGTLQYKQGKKAEAKASFLRATQLDPNYIDPKLSLAVLHEEDSDWQAALDLYRQAEALVQDAEVKKWVTTRAVWMAEIAATTKRQIAGEK